MKEDNTIIIVGGGIAGVHSALSLRKEGYKGRVLLFDRDSNLPYDRPPLSKDFILGKSDEKVISLVKPTELEELEIELKLGEEIKSVDIEKKVVVSENGTSYRWDKLLLATGTNLRRLKIEGDHLENIFYLKTLSDAKQIKESLKDVKEIAVVGAGFIGAELASTFTQLGKKVTIIERSDLPMERIFGPKIGEFFLNLHKNNGVDVITGDSVKVFKGEKQVEQIITDNGHVVNCQAVVIGIGVDPNTPFTHEKLKINRGYVVDEYGQTTVKDIFAAGDCAVWPYNGNHIHVEHWDHAVYHGQTVAKNMIADEPQRYNRLPYFWSDQYGARIQYVGHAIEYETVVFRGGLESGKFTCFYLDKDDFIQAALVFNEPKNIIALRKIINQRQKIKKEFLMDTSIPLRQLFAKPSKV